MLDRGSNLVLFKDEVISQMAVVESDVPKDVVGVWQASASSIGRTLRARFRLGPHVIELTGGEAPSARRNIISESVLWDSLGWSIDAVENDNVRLRSNQRRAPVEQATPNDHTASKPGERLLLDCFGKIEAASVTTGAQFVLEACCQVTAFGYEAPSRRHTLKVWIGFVHHVLVAEGALGHETMYLRWDRAPELDDHNQIELKANLKMEFGLVVEFGAVARGPKGAGCAPQSTTKGRTSVGTFVGWSGSSYLVKLHRGTTVTRTSITVCSMSTSLRVVACHRAKWALTLGRKRQTMI